ncbi:MAG: hypothetical protein ACI4T8_02060 [Christensenellales bacterium]
MARIVVPTIINDLANFAKTKNKQVYLVGGAVRDWLIDNNKRLLDFDVCGDLTIDEIVEFAYNCGYKIKEKVTGIEVIKFDGEVPVQYARIRSEEYKKETNHFPSNVKFDVDLKDDARRRDFTINAIYYDLNSFKILDFFNGMSDITDKIIRQICDNNFHSLSFDPERILRMVELSIRLNFKIEEQTLNLAFSKKNNLKLLSKDRFNILISKIKSEYNGSLQQKQLLEQFDLLKYIF